jgi:hypothetical protein
MLQILCTFACNEKKRLVQIAQGMGAEGKKYNDGGGEFNYDIL